MQAIIFALIAYFGWGVGDIFGTIAVRKIGPYSTALWRFILGIILFSLYAPFALNSLKNLSFYILAINIVIGIIGIIGLLCFYEGLRRSSPSLVGTIYAGFAALVVVFSVIFLKEPITTSQVISIVIIFLGIFLCTFDFKQIKKGKRFIDAGVLFAIAAMFSHGIYFTFIKIPVQALGWYWPAMISLLMFPLLLIFMKVRKIALVNPTHKGVLFPVIANSILLTAAEFSFNSAIGRGLTTIVAPIAGSYPTLFVVLAFLIFKDPIKKQQIVGIITTLVGIVLLSIFSV